MLAPYIIAENPDIDGSEAIRLSQRMMDGRKMEAFMLDLSFIGWHILGYLTFGLVEGLWVVPYRTAAFTEFYADAREEAKAKAIEGREYLNDEYLFTGVSINCRHSENSMISSIFSSISFFFMPRIAPFI